jgi:type II secretory pathway pseudopilin PulG
LADSHLASRPKSYLVAERERVPAPVKGAWQWVIPLFTTPNQTFIEKCGLDAYFFLRFLRMLLKIFVPLSVVILPILLPINKLSCHNCTVGPDQLGWRNIPAVHANRTWAHLVLAVLTILWVLHVIYTELRGYIRIRQAYLASPQHRIRASATTVLVSGIPRKWLTVDALNGLYDVFPGGIRNIWINRNFDDLADKVTERNDIAQSLEEAETNLIQMCMKKHRKMEAKKAKEEGRKKTKQEQEQDRANADEQAERVAQGNGVSSGDPHQVPHNLQEVLEELEEDEHKHDKQGDPSQDRLRDKLGQGFGAVGHGFGAIGTFGRKVVGDVAGDVNRVIHNVNDTVGQANNMTGFDADLAEYPKPASGPAPTTAPTSEPVPTFMIGLFDKENKQSEPERSTKLSKSHDVTVQDRAGLSLDDSECSEPSSANTRICKDAARTDKNAKSGIKDSTSPAQDENPEPRSPTRRMWDTLNRQIKAPPLPLPSPEPHAAEGDEYPLHVLGEPQNLDTGDNHDEEASKGKSSNKFGWLLFWKNNGEEEDKLVYPEAFDEELAKAEEDEPLWKLYIEAKDRETLREPIFNKSWWPRLPPMGKKIDKIYYLRKELARLNVEIEEDQQNAERFPLMSSAFIQFNHQVAAHMACQSVSHHMPQHMTPRLVEISPTDVLWDNMSMKWWERYLRGSIVFAAVIGMLFLWAPVVTVSGFLSTLDTLKTISWLSWISKLPPKAVDVVQGVLPPIFLSIVLALVPIILRLLVKQSGVPTGNGTEMGVQIYYFTFLFIQVFLIVTLSSGLPAFFKELATETSKIPETLASNLPRASNYFFSYLTVQALNNSASALLQVAALLEWFLWAPMMDTTARQKWSRQTKLRVVKWGSFFPPFTNFAVIGIIFSVIAPLVMVFNLIVFSIYWITQRYNALYVYQYRHDTGGLLFPRAINQLFVGLYVMEIALIGLFFAFPGTRGTPQAIIMIIMFVGTAIFQWLINDAFAPLFRYLPITLEDDAVIRDEEFARAQQSKWQSLADQQVEHERINNNYEMTMEEREREEAEAEELALAEERRMIRERRRAGSRVSSFSSHDNPYPTIMSTKPANNNSGDRWRTGRTVKLVSEPVRQLRKIAQPHAHGHDGSKPTALHVNPQDIKVDMESQREVGDVLFGGFSDELEDLTPEERDTLIRYSFQHSALRARRPVVWIPRDKLGISDDEIERTKRMSTVEDIDKETEKKTTRTNIWISNEGTALNARDKVVFRKSPPDFANVDLIAL